jgi:hypothetical protein
LVLCRVPRLTNWPCKFVWLFLLQGYTERVGGDGCACTRRGGSAGC